MGQVIINPHISRQVEAHFAQHMPPPPEPEPITIPRVEAGEEISDDFIDGMLKSVEQHTNPQRERWLHDPVLWAQERLGITPWSKQADIMHSVRDHPDTAVHTCHNIGKSYAAAMLVCWWIDAHEPGEAFVVTTAPTGAQVKAILWRYINAMHQRSGLVGRTNMTEWIIGSELVAYGRKPSEYQPDAFQGIHALYVLVVLDEACGIPPSLWDASSTLTSNAGGRTLAIGNPDDPNARFAQVCTPGSGWNTIGIGAFDTPNFTGEPVSETLTNSLISPHWVERKKVEWGVDSPLYISKVLGRFPIDADDGVVPMSYVSPCRYLADDTSIASGERHGGLDVGETTDRTVLFIRDGMRVLAHHVVEHHSDAMNAVGQIVEHINRYDLKTLTVDVIGIGWGVYSRLKELSSEDNPTSPHTTHACHVKRFSAGEQAHDPERFFNKRSELWWEVGRELSRTRTWDLTYLDDDVVAELTTPKYSIEGSHSRVKVEAKDEVRKRLGRSPDLADALLMAFYTGDPPPPPGSTNSRGNLQLAGTVL